MKSVKLDEPRNNHTAGNTQRLTKLCHRFQGLDTPLLPQSNNFRSTQLPDTRGGQTTRHSPLGRGSKPQPAPKGPFLRGRVEREESASVYKPPPSSPATPPEGGHGKQWPNVSRTWTKTLGHPTYGRPFNSMAAHYYSPGDPPVEPISVVRSILRTSTTKRRPSDQVQGPLFVQREEKHVTNVLRESEGWF